MVERMCGVRRGRYDSRPDAESLHHRNPWIVTKAKKNPDPRAARLEIARHVKQANEANISKLCAQCKLLHRASP